MRVIVVGNGLAGTIASKTLRELDKEVTIDIYAEEKYLYYPRPNLIEFLAGNLDREKLFAFSEHWYQDQQLHVHLSQPVKKIKPDSKEVELEGGQREKYDNLLLANGAHAFVPPFHGADKKGVFTLRTVKDALGILDWLQGHSQVVIIGGGLLGLEISRALRKRGAHVQVVEFFNRLLPRQLDALGAEVLKSQIEKMGIEVKLGKATEHIRGDGSISGVRFKGGEEVEASTAVVAAGVRSNINLAQQAGLEVDRGLVVNDYLQTSHKHIFAAGDNIQHKGRLYGIIPASFNQARTAAYNIAGQESQYEGTIPSNTLKVVGLNVTSMGLVNPEEETFEEYRKEIREKGIYKKIVIKDGKVVGAIWMGTKENVNHINRLILQHIDVKKWKQELLEDNFDFSLL